MTSPTQLAPRIFVSYSSTDRAFAQRVVADLQRAGATVWYDVTGIDEGDFIAKINDALRQCEWFVLILTPNAIDSRWVNAAIHRRDQGFLRGVFPILAAPCVQGSIPPLWDTLHRFDATADYTRALADLGARLGLTVGSPSGVSAIPLDRFPSRLAQLGYTTHRSGAGEYIVPPRCAVPAGEFLLGSDPKQDSRADDDEQPQHRLTLLPFQIARFPVTVAEYACFVRAGGSEPQRWEYQGKVVDWQTQLTRLDHPVVCVTWRDALAYAAWLVQLTGQPWRLPSEAEWEKAARWDPAQRHARIYPWGDAFDQARCNTSESGIGTTTPVGSYPSGASPCGAQDLAGNVWEWTSSLDKPYPYTPYDGRGRADSTDNRVLRGGSWFSGARGARAACRNHDVPGLVLVSFGFRLALAVPGSF